MSTKKLFLGSLCLIILCTITFQNNYPLTEKKKPNLEIPKLTIFPTIAKITNIEKMLDIEKEIGQIEISKINVKENLYEKSSSKNNVNQHVTILKESIEPNQENSILFLAAHSGSGKVAYFKDLDKLQRNDLITLVYKERTYIYQISSIWEEDKNGYIHVQKENTKQLILTTCSPKHDKKQLIISCILVKEK